MIFVRRLIWDAWNVPHIALHDVTPGEAEEVCQGPYIIRGAYKGRVMLIGPTGTGRILAVILEPEAAGIYYPVTARPASRRERRLYQQGGGEKIC
ncbi:MAG: BrnT family toxin [Dehalococcoidia bacterium]|nr:BrnT family toxin [Dehalococcoidia bacterium]